MLKRLFFFLFVLVLITGAAALWGRQRVNTPYRGFVEDEIFVDLPAGTGVSGIADRLAAAGVIPDPWSFRLAVRFSGADRKLQAGEYRFSGATTPTDVIARIVAGDTFRHAITFREGLTIFEMADLFAKSGLGAAKEFVQAASDRAIAAQYDPSARTLEGYLFPDTYPLSRRASAVEAVRLMRTRFDRAFDNDLRAAAAAQGLTIHEAVTLASLIEKETGQASERPLIGAVFRNRLKIGMPLQCDPTIIYALMLAGRWDGNLRRADLQMSSPYNTYQVRGLPPGPIASPGRASLEAAVHPADAKYLYFVSRNDGTHVFANTLAEHNRNVQQWQKKGQR